jgi:hypothetical protein
MAPSGILKYIGKTSEPFILEVEKGAIKRFAAAIGDNNPLYWQESHENSPNYKIAAPPGFFGWPTKWFGSRPFNNPLKDELSDALKEAGYSRFLDGGIEFEFYKPVFSGDILVAVIKVVEIYQKKSTQGALIFVVFETTYKNKYGKLIAKARQTRIAR